MWCWPNNSGFSALSRTCWCSPGPTNTCRSRVSRSTSTTWPSRRRVGFARPRPSGGHLGSRRGQGAGRCRRIAARVPQPRRERRQARGKSHRYRAGRPGRGVVLTVDDDGPGIPESERDRVLQRFVRLDEARSRDDGGSGLGLSIVDEVVRAHGGSMSIRRSPLGGARIQVAMPADEG